MIEENTLNALRSNVELELLTVGEYTITKVGDIDFWIQHKSGEGMQVFKVNFERLIDEFYKAEF